MVRAGARWRSATKFIHVCVCVCVPARAPCTKFALTTEYKPKVGDKLHYGPPAEILGDSSPYPVIYATGAGIWKIVIFD